MASSLAITLDMLKTANAVGRGGARRQPFEVETLKINRTATKSFEARDIVIVPGLGTATEAELMTRLASPPIQRAVRLLSEAHSAGAFVAAENIQPSLFTPPNSVIPNNMFLERIKEPP